MNFTHTYQKEEQTRLEKVLVEMRLSHYAPALLDLNEQGWQRLFSHGDFLKWNKGFENLPNIQTCAVEYADVVQIKPSKETHLDKNEVRKALQVMSPWRKGPFEIFGVAVDTEWRSDMKWNRLLPHLSSLKGKKVLDIGCGSGYHMWRMLEQEAGLVLGIDPTPLFTLHFSTVKRYQQAAHTFLIPTGVDELPNDMDVFDTVFSMGILYHRKEPLAHLQRIKDLLVADGEIVLETLVVDGDSQTCLVPEGRYAKMRNVWFLPSVEMLMLWMTRLGFKNVRCVDVNTTSTYEQRSTDWMKYESLSDYLNPDDSSQTIEGYPAPKRAIFLGNK